MTMTFKEALAVKLPDGRALGEVVLGKGGRGISELLDDEMSMPHGFNCGIVWDAIEIITKELRRIDDTWTIPANWY